MEEKFDKLKLCPFCGKAAEIVSISRISLTKIYYYVKCNGCNTHSADYRNEEDAIKAWNQRI